MLKKITTSIFAAAAGLLLATNISSAAVFDFVAIADSGVAPYYGEKGGNPLTFVSGAITLDARGTDPNGAAYAYLDKSGNPATHAAPAGLGVCSVLTATLQCNPGSDDNVTSGEILHLDFNEKVKTEDWSFHGKSHGSLFAIGDKVDVSVDGGAYVSYLLNVINFTNFGSLISGQTFDLRYNNVDFYLATVSAVPLPSSVLLFGAALVGLGWLGHRRKRSALTS